MAAHENRGGSALLGLGEVVLILGEGQMPGLRLVGGGKAGDLNRSIAKEFGPELFSQLGSGESGHGLKDKSGMTNDE